MSRAKRLDPALLAGVVPRLTRYIPCRPTPRQAAFLLLGALEAFYGGAAGGGKTAALQPRYGLSSDWKCSRSHGRRHFGHRQPLKPKVESSRGRSRHLLPDAACGALYGECSADRVNRRNGYRSRTFDTRTGTMELAVPKVRSGTYFPEWLLEPRRRAERALVAVVAECYVKGVSTRRVDGLVKAIVPRR